MALHPFTARTGSRPRSRAAKVLVGGLLIAQVLGLPVDTGVRAAEDAKESERFPEVARLPMFGDPTPRSGWLLLNTVTRRGYQITEVPAPTANTPRTVIHSFDLDTLRLRRRVELAGVPIGGGTDNAATLHGTVRAAEPVHAVDEEGHRLYLALSFPQAFDQAHATLLAGAGEPPDGRRPLARFVAIDEDRLDAGRPDFAASFREPELQDHLHSYWVAGMAVNRTRSAQGAPGRLLALFAHPQPGSQPFYDHTLAQWDPANLQFTESAALETTPTAGLVSVPGQVGVRRIAAAGPVRRLDACTSGSLASGGSQGGYQWGLLVLRNAVWTACQAAEGAGAATRVPIDDSGNLDVTAPHDLYRLSQRIADVLPDSGGERLLLRSWGDGHTWWTFDTAQRRFTGSVAAKASDGFTMVAGVDQTTGRLYQLTQDYAAFLGGRMVPFRGGFSFSDTRLDPPPPLENARPELAYPSGFAIRVDPKTRRVFLRRAVQGVTLTPVYPGTADTAPAPPEPFYRVLLDNVPLTEPPPPPDDSKFTTDVEESSLTKASYLGSGQAYGARTLLVGGLDAASNRNQAVQQSPCAKDDREILAGAVRGAEVSDLSTKGEAAGLDADAKTRDDLATPVTRCWPEKLNNNDNAKVPRPPSQAETNELAFDEVDTRNKATYDDNRDGQPDRDGDNRYRTTCTDDQEGRKATGPTGKHVSRKGFAATASCAHGKGKADAAATGGFSDPFLAAVPGAAPAGGTPTSLGVQVGYAHSEVHVSRKAGEGVTVEVDSIARDVVIPGVGTIGLVRGEATVRSSGRRGGAGAQYTRTVCDVDFGGFGFRNCLTGEELEAREAQFSRAMGTRGRIRFRDPDPTLYDGSPSGYKAGVQRPVADLFEDAKIARDTSVALPAMELVFFNGDGSAGTGRQFVQLAGVQAGTSYGIACLYGQRPDGRCGSPDDQFASDEHGTDDDDEGSVAAAAEPGGTQTITVTEPGQGVQLPGQNVVKTKPLWRRILEAPVNLVKDVLRLLFANPREFGLMAAVWALLYAPCYLGERRRSIRNLRARRAALGSVA
ncbi:MAG: hypothetical protein M3394_02875 [Actinomycetota bacterium]|nr:hypothetical protein [Actinomycetota bacterium]